MYYLNDYLLFNDMVTCEDADGETNYGNHGNSERTVPHVR